VRFSFFPDSLLGENFRNFANRLHSTRIETWITRHTERRAGFTSGFDTPKQTKTM
jgi:hypothetical protein